MPNAPITILGLGLIGSSIARAAHETGMRVTGYDPLSDAMRHGEEEGYLTATDSPEQAVQHADLVILAAPIRELPALMKHIAPHLKPGAIVSDISSVKQCILRDVAPLASVFVPAHPIAGKAESGFVAADAALFQKRRVIITPCPQGDETAMRSLAAFWEALGARVELMEAETHDAIYAYLSHLPQLLAYVAAETLASTSLPQPLPEQFRLFIRLGGSSPSLWSDIFLANRALLIEALDIFLHVARHIREELAGGQEQSERSDTVPLSLFPRVVASSLVTTVTLFERQSGQSVARYAGQGFADFASPALSTPDADIEQISLHYAQIVELLNPFLQRCAELRELIVTGQEAVLTQRLGAMRQANADLLTARN